MGDQVAGQRARHPRHIPWQKVEEAIYSGSGGRRQQIQRHFFRFIGCVLFAVAAWATDPPFSHKQHAPLKVKCASCHDGGSEAAQFPKLEKCHVCHTEMSERKIPSRRVYQLPDFVFFSHARHKTECATCHGDVWTKDVLTVERPLKMANCISCHRENHATARCNICHELGQ